MATTTVQPAQIKSGPALLRYAPPGTAIPTITATASKLTATWTNWVEPGASEGGVSYTESTDTEELRVAESLYPVRTVTTGKTMKVAGAFTHISDLNWKLVMNGGTITVTGTTGTKMSVYVPPLMGSENRVMFAIQSLDDEEIIIWPQVFNVGSVETNRGTLDQMATLPFEFNVELPDPAVMTTPYKRWTAGGLSQGV